jgi:uncharacterized protein YecE (DUF72 family)
LERAVLLKDKLGPILFQLPPHWHFNEARLEEFLKALPGRLRFTLELRDQTWINEKTLNLLAKYGVAFCIYEINYYLSPKETTADFVYIRLHGPKGAYQGRYSTETLKEWSKVIATWSRQGREIFCYFDNDEAGYAAQNAWELQDMVKKQ